MFSCIICIRYMHTLHSNSQYLYNLHNSFYKIPVLHIVMMPATPCRTKMNFSLMYVLSISPA